MKILATVSAVLFIAGCEQVTWRMGGDPPEPAARLQDIDIDTVATVTIAGQKDRVERILHLIVERDPEVVTMVEMRTR